LSRDKVLEKKQEKGVKNHKKKTLLGVVEVARRGGGGGKSLTLNLHQSNRGGERKDGLLERPSHGTGPKKIGGRRSHVFPCILALESEVREASYGL